MIEAKDLSFGYGREKVLEKVNCRVENGQVTGIVGPNGAGKSTLMRLMARILKPEGGKVLLDGNDAASFDRKTFARRLAYLPQSRPVPELSVRTLVELGRYAHPKGGNAVEQAIRDAGLEALAGRDVRTLSGGQRQMAYLAMLMAQGSPHVLMDEPLTHLDAGGRLEVTQLIRRMKNEGKCVAVILHDLAMLETVCDRAVLLSRGRVAFKGDARECLYSSQLEEAFGVRVMKRPCAVFEKR